MFYILKLLSVFGFDHSFKF